jgi:uncharacterized protein (TIGR03083 family)
MTTPNPLDDELAALLALDALEPAEQADAELRYGTFPPQLSEIAATLAEATETAPPADLRAATIAHALARRPAGRPTGAPRPCTAAAAYDRTVAEFAAMLGTLTDAEWLAAAHPEHGAVRDVVAHLVGVERLNRRWLDPQQPDTDAEIAIEHIAATRPVVESLAGTAPQDIARQWHEAAIGVAAAARTGDPQRRVPFHDITTSVDGLLVMRTFELWAHGMDIALATEQPIPALDPERMALLSSRLMDALPRALAYRGRPQRGRTARFVLTGAAGGLYVVALDPRETAGEPDVTIVADVIDLCRVAARRLHPDALEVTVDGDRELAAAVLAGVDAFARD